MNYWLITDTHFNHRKLEEYSGRPSNFEELIINGLKEIPKEDTLIHLGDICIGKDKDWHEELKRFDFTKILVIGNHDHKSNNWYSENGWDFVCRYFSFEFMGKRILFSHEPREVMEDIDINIHGHWHNNEHREAESCGIYDKAYHKLLAIEYTNYKPIRLDTFLK